MSLILFGFKNCGKTHFGRRVAERLGLPFVDTDDLICQLDGRQEITCRDIAKEKGESFFRALEKKAINSIQPGQRRVISVGGGAILDPQNCTHLQRLGKLVYLQAPKELLIERLVQRELPSFLDPADPLTSFEKMYQERLPIYESIDAMRLDLENKSEEDVILTLIALEKKDG